MMEILARNWWVLALRGLVAVLFGIATFVRPDVTLATLVILWGAYAIVDGVGSSVYAFTKQATFRWLWLIEGLAGIAAGIATLVWPGISAVVLLYVIAGWALFTGIVEIVQAITLRNEIANEWLLGLSGISSLVFGGMLLFLPGPGALAVLWLIGSYALVFGVLLIALGFQLRSLGQLPQNRDPQPAPTNRKLPVAI